PSQLLILRFQQPHSLHRSHRQDSGASEAPETVRRIARNPVKGGGEWQASKRLLGCPVEKEAAHYTCNHTATRRWFTAGKGTLTFYAHTSDSTDVATWELLEDHLRKVAQLCSNHCTAFDSGEWGYLLGLWHDL